MSAPDREAVRREAERWWGVMHGPHSEESRDGFEAWRAADPQHAAEYAALERTWDTASGLGATEMGRNRTLAPAPQTLAWATGPRLAIAATVLLLIAIGIGFGGFGGSNPVIADAQATTIGQIKKLVLPDGTTVTLDTNSRLEVQFDDKVRRVKLTQGRARFDVKADPARSFVVAAAGKLVTVQDAGFDVQIIPQGLCLSAMRGTVDIKADVPEIATAATVRLDQGRTVRFDASGAATPSAPVEKGSEQWVDGMLVYHGAPLSAVLADTNRYAQKPILLGDPSLGDLKVTGVFRPLPVDQLAASLAAAFDLDVRKEPNGSLTLVRR